MDRSKQLGEGKILPLLIKFSVPAIVGMMVNALYNVVDRIFVGQGVGYLAIAGITVAFPFFFVMMAFGMLVGLGGAALISIRLGEGNKEEADTILANGTAMLVVISVVLTVVGLIFMDPLLRLFGASEGILPYAKDYMGIIIWGSMFQYLSFGLNNYIRAEGNPKIAMLTMLIGAVLNIGLDPLFIFVFNMGIRGAALATILSQAVAASWVLYYFIRGKSLLKFPVHRFRLDPRIITKIAAIGSAPFMMQIAASVLVIIFNNSLLFYGGDMAISAMGIINSISMLILMPIFGLNQGAQPIIGYNYGAHQYERVKETLKWAAMAATCVTVLGFIMIQLNSEGLIRIFNRDDDTLLLMGAQGLRIFLAMLPIIGFQIISANYFQAIGKPKHAMFLSLSRQVLLLIPALLILPRVMGLGLTGLWMAGPVSDLGSSVLTGIFLIREWRQLNAHAERERQLIYEQ